MYSSEAEQLARWWSRRYKLPPNHPLYRQETTAYWQAQYLMDRRAEADLIGEKLRGPQATTPQARAQALEMQKRLVELHKMLGLPAPGHDDLLSEDLAASRRGELPAFLERRMARNERPLRAR